MTVPARDPLRIAVAGAGAFGREHLDRLTARNDVRVVGIADPDPVALAHARQRYGVACCLADPLQMLNETDAQAVVVATPADSHIGIVLHALKRNICILLEKPVAPSTALAAKLVSAQRSSQAFIIPGHVLRFSADHQKLVEIAQSGQIGKILYVNSRRYRDDSHAQRYADVDPVLMTMIHDIDLALWIAQSSFRSARAYRSADSGFRSMTLANATTASGIFCELRTAWTFANGELPPDRLEVVGDKGSIELDAGHMLNLYAQGGRNQIPLTGGDDPLHNEHDHFLSCVADRTLWPALTLSDAVAGLKLADAILQSLQLNREVNTKA